MTTLDWNGGRAGALFGVCIIILASVSHRLYENDTHFAVVSSRGDTRIAWQIAFWRGLLGFG
jgi:hypothetical protein